MAIVVVFMLGVANFAMHRAVMESGHPLIGQLPWFYHAMSGRFSLMVEFLLLLGVLLFTAQGAAWVAGSYVAYSLVNALAAWLIVTHRV